MRQLPQEYFYTAQPYRKCVSKKEFELFVSSYPRRLDVDVTGIYDPPLVTYNDFELANRWPYSVVASTFMYDDDPAEYFYLPEDERTYIIVCNYDELYKSKTGNVAKTGE